MANPSFYFSKNASKIPDHQQLYSSTTTTAPYKYQGNQKEEFLHQYRNSHHQNNIQQPVPKSNFLQQHILHQQQYIQQHWTEQQQIHGIQSEIHSSGASKSMGQIPSPYNTPPLPEFYNYPNRTSGKSQIHSFSVSSESPQMNQMIQSSPSPHQLSSLNIQSHQQQNSANNSGNILVNSQSPRPKNIISSASKQQETFHLNLETYKSQACTIKKVHNHKQCHYYHHEKDRKRIGFSYSADICEFIEQDKECPFADDCPNSHNKVEQLFRPDKYKKKFCVHYPHNLSKCEYGTFCSFAHSENDIKIELIHHYLQNDEFFMYHFKTVWCPFNYINHDKGGCVYAHNWQDFRRRPDQYRYEAVPCPFWKPTEIVQNYDKGCPEGMHCQKCHGWKEYDFFPMIYKTRACDNGKKCIKGNCCPFYHHPESRRIKNSGKISLGVNQLKGDFKDLISFSGTFDEEVRNLENELFSTKSTIRDTNPAFSGMSFKEDMDKVPRNERRFSFEKEILGGDQKKYALANEKITDDLFKEILEEANDNSSPIIQNQERPKSRTLPVKFYGSQKQGGNVPNNQYFSDAPHLISINEKGMNYQQGSHMEAHYNAVYNQHKTFNKNQEHEQTLFYGRK